MVKTMGKFFTSKEKKVNIKIEEKSITEEEKKEIRKAKQILENPSLTIKLANKIGHPIEMLIEKVDSKKLTKITEKAHH